MKRRKSPFLVFLCCVLAVPTCGVLVGDLVLPGAWTEATLSLLRPWLTVGVLLGAAHLLVRPILRLLSAPIGCLTLGLFGLVIDVALIYVCAHFVEGFAVSGLLYAVLTAILINTICAIVGSR
ncbi:MAG: phage holin family protein [Candidatus Faecivicinus sp.]|nr:phage holin family protein [Candidatus Faecivicinus sp.]